MECQKIFFLCVNINKNIVNIVYQLNGVSINWYVVFLVKNKDFVLYLKNQPNKFLLLYIFLEFKKKCFETI